MEILAVDTSAVCACVAVTQDTKILSEASTNSGLTHSRTLLPMIDSVLKNAEIDLDSIDFFACSVGPGSFTGIRIGVAAIKGFADAMGKKCMPVSTLEALAYNLCGQDVTAVCVMDARCKQVYTATFDISGEKITRLSDDEAISIDELGERLKSFEKKIVFLGDGAKICHDALGYEMVSPLLVFQRGASVALTALKNFDESKLVSASELMPVYLRLPQAERELKKKQSSESPMKK